MKAVTKLHKFIGDAKAKPALALLLSNIMYNDVPKLRTTKHHSIIHFANVIATVDGVKYRLDEEAVVIT